MPKVVAVHRITKGKDHWLNSPKREAFFGPLGVSNLQTYVNPNDSTHVAISMDVADLDAVFASLTSPAGAAAMEHDGVDPESLTIFIAE